MVRNFCLFLVLFAVCGYAQDILSGAYPPEQLKKLVLSPQQWQPYPKWGETDQWLGVPEMVRHDHIREAEALLGTEWATPRASVFLDYVRNGDRSRFQAISFGRRSRLTALVLGECFEGKGRFMDDIADGIWAICEETYWGVPAHVGMQKKGPGLPDVKEPTVDLFAAETGGLLAWTYYLLYDQLRDISPLLPERIEYEVKRRIIDVLLARSDFWWMGLQDDPDHHVNNWNPWICSNWLSAVLVLEKDQERRIKSVHKICRCLDQFLNPYPRDGGCDEGPGYWGHAGSSLYDCLALLHSVSKGEIDVFDQPLIREIGRYIYRVHIAGDYYVNFADASAITRPMASQVYRYGKAIQDPKMTGFGAYLAERQEVGGKAALKRFGGLMRGLPALLTMRDLPAEKPAVPLLRDVWFPDLQVAIAREKQGSTTGFYLAAKGGHNNESHNHNDVGNFLVFYDGIPLMIDVGVEEYTAKTFSSRRYEIWTMQSAFHNCPTVNGTMQAPGAQYRAADLDYAAEKKRARFSLEMSGAYPDSAGIQTWKRTVELERGTGVRIIDDFTLTETGGETFFTLMTWARPENAGNGRLAVHLEDKAAQTRPVYIDFPAAKLDAEIEPITVTDSRLKPVWGETVYRTKMRLIAPKRRDRIEISISDE